MNRVKVPYPSTQDEGYEKSLRDKVSHILSQGDDAPVAPLVDSAAVRDRLDSASSHTHNQMGQRMQLERIIDLNAWLTDYQVELAV